ncbi:MAG: methionine--tRNA ligase subunit beta [bacterium]|nr:methionine--tRNA ligase subunit beta [bacterium]
MENKITIDDFKKIDLRVAKVLAAEKVGNSDKLLKLQIDLGYEQRQILAGIGQHYQAEDLIGCEIIVVANLEPRNLRDLESNGMLLAATDPDGAIRLLNPDAEVTPGSKIS